MDQTACTAGYAKLDVTPPLGTVMGGYYHIQRFVEGVLDPLYVRAVAFGEGEKSAVLLVLDNCGIEGDSGFEWPVKIARTLGLSQDAVFMTCTHTHTSPTVAGDSPFGVHSDEQYDAWLFRRLCDAARMALDDRRPVLDVRADELDAGGLTYVRRYRMKDGSVVNNPPAGTQEDLDKIDGPLGESDTTMRLVRILRQDAPELVLVNFQTHPDCIGGSKVSADFPAGVCARVEEQVANSRCVFLNGCEGQMVINDRTKLVPKMKDYGRALAHGEKIADAALSMYDKAPSTGMSGLVTAQAFAHAKTKRDPSRAQEAAETVARFQKGGLEAVHPEKHMRGRTVANAIILNALEQGKLDYKDLPVTALVFCGVALVGLPGEPFCQIGKQIRAGSKFPVTCVCCLTNGAFGYYPMVDSYDEGGYEAGGAFVARGGAELLIETANKLLAEL